ncbi:MAG: dihydrodipicolinate synthase family protein [Deltaproteobacteria bacterium]|nr:dihydrodipicolinate synthase family protein [Deltaproteobacteria bacterium]MBW2309290.1 dihydrodipicolinate synthase family protein [Deltaproteobacteria bacterium]
MDRKLEGMFPILATPFNDDGSIDWDSQKRLIQYLIERGVHGIVMLANASEGYTLSDSEKKKLIELAAKEIEGRVPLVVTVSHFSSEVASEHANYAENMGAFAVMSYPPFFGQWSPDTEGIREYFDRLSNAIKIPIIYQDHPLSGVKMPASALAEIAKRVDRLRYIKTEFVDTLGKIPALNRLAENSLDGVFGGAGGLNYIHELEVGACGNMPACYMSKVLSDVFNHHRAARKKEAERIFFKHLPLISFELYHGGRYMVKEILKKNGIIKSTYCRHKAPKSWHEVNLKALNNLLSKYDLNTF